MRSILLELTTESKPSFNNGQRYAPAAGGGSDRSDAPYHHRLIRSSSLSAHCVALVASPSRHVPVAAPPKPRGTASSCPRRLATDGCNTITNSCSFFHGGCSFCASRFQHRCLRLQLLAPVGRNFSVIWFQHWRRLQLLTSGLQLLC